MANEMAAFYMRPWRGNHCSLDEICAHAASRKVDPYSLMKQCYGAGEYLEPLFTPIDVYSKDAV